MRSYLLVVFIVAFCLPVAAQPPKRRLAPQPAAFCTTPPVGVVSWYTGDGNVLDGVSRNNGTIVGNGGVSFTAGKVGQAITFNGDAISAVTVPDSPSLHITSSLTLEGWINPSSGVTGLSSIEFKGNANNLAKEPYSVFLNVVGTDQYKLDVRLGSETTAAALDSNALIPVGQWTHFAATYDGTTLNIYLNGALDNSGALGLGALNNSDTNSMVFGDISGNYKGSLDEFSIYSRVLSPSEILAIFQSQTNGKCKPAATVAPNGVVGWWPADGSGHDISAEVNNLTLNGGAGFVSGKSGQAFSLDGTTGYFQGPSIAAQDPTTAASVEAWVYVRQLPTGAARANILSKGGLELRVNSIGGFEYCVGPTVGCNLIGGTTQAALNTWYHVVGVWDATGYGIYVNGNLENFAPITFTRSPSGSPLDIGAVSGGGNGFFRGLLDEVTLYNRALTPAEVTS
ncbi:MAG: LamG domain-containing protein, partial [Acidobacteria bacterium]|nr:LamG domain-containing protein [Acidobacteriota bacterium]